MDYVSQVDDEIWPVGVDAVGRPSGSVVGQKVGLPGAAALPGGPDVRVRDDSVSKNRSRPVPIRSHRKTVALYTYSTLVNPVTVNYLRSCSLS